MMLCRRSCIKSRSKNRRGSSRPTSNYSRKFSEQRSINDYYRGSNRSDIIYSDCCSIARMITKPVRQITKAAVGITAGNLGQQIEIRTNDEIGRLAHAFNEMSQNLKTTIAAIVDERGNLATVLTNFNRWGSDDWCWREAFINKPGGRASFNFKKENVNGHPLIEAVHDYEIGWNSKKMPEYNPWADGAARNKRAVHQSNSSTDNNGQVVFYPGMFQDLTDWETSNNAAGANRQYLARFKNSNCRD